MRDEKTGALRRVAMGLILSLSFASVSLAHESPGYAHDARILTRHPDWMGKLKDDVRLSQLSLPGTHDTMSFYGGEAVQTQTLSLPNQLESGVRVLDIRCRHVRFQSFVFAIVHGSVHQNAYFDDVLNATVAFLKKHPREVVYMRVKEEGNPQNIPADRTFELTFRDQYWINPRWREYFWPYHEGNPSLGEVRGKIVILQDFKSPYPRFYGINYHNGFFIQDHFNLPTTSDLYGKWLLVLKQMHAANDDVLRFKYINYLSGSSAGVRPYFVASGHSSTWTSAPRLATGFTTPGWRHKWPDFPRVDCWRVFWTNFCTIAFEGTNILTYERLPSFKRVGIIMADFPGPGLIERVIALNAKYKK
jgi:1-phosphatidylinositol phosphodiesterase